MWTRVVTALAAATMIAAGCGSDGGTQSVGTGTAPGGTGLVAAASTADRPPSGADDDAVARLDATGRYDIGEFTGTDIWVDPLAGDDAADGATRETAMRTVNAAWQRIPAGATLTTGYRLRLVAGSYPQETSVNYWEDRRGTAEAPVIIEAADGPHTAVFAGDMNVFGVSYLYVIGVDIIREGDAFHCEQCDHILLRDLELSGGSGDSIAHETVKINQSQHVYIEGSDIHGADDNAIDFVAVQYGHVIGNRIHDAQDWCMYAKGGSAYLRLAANEVYDCGTGGITAGQGTGFEFMRAPWLQYEAYGIDIVDNTVHDTDGAGLGVAGGYDIVLAHNTLYRVGSRSHAVEFVRGRRGCDGTVDLCTANHDAGGWGSDAGEEQFIPNRHVVFADNLVVNPADAPSQWQHLQVDGPVDPPASSGVPSPSRADDDLVIVGNVFWNGPADFPLGVGDGCAPDNPTCNEAQIRADNAVNAIEPEFVDPEHGDFRLTEASAAALPAAVPVPPMSWGDAPAGVPAGGTDTDVSTTQDGSPRTSASRPGAR